MKRRHTKPHTPRIGSISTGTLRAEDLIPVFVQELRYVRGALPRAIAEQLQQLKRYGTADAPSECVIDEARGEVLEALLSALNDCAPDYTYFGAHPGDGADFGFWVCSDIQTLMKEDGVPCVADIVDVKRDGVRASGPYHTNGRLACVVNDHGNMTLYRRVPGGWAEVWSIV